MSPPRPTNGSVRFALAVTGAHLAVVLLGLWHHEMWRDELQAWLVADRAHSVLELFQNLEYEGNPALWHSLLYLLSSFTHDPVAMQGLHALIASGFVYVLCRHAPFTRAQKLLFAFGYLSIFEYALISRGYGLGLLLAFAFCALFPARRERPLLLGGILFLLANTTVFGLWLALCLAGLLALEALRSDGPPAALLRRWLPAGLLFAVGAGLAVLQIQTEPNNSFPARNHFGFAWDAERFGMALSSVFNAYAPVPALDTLHFWETQWLRDSAVGGWIPLLSVLLFAAACLGFAGTPTVLLFYAVATLGLLTLYYYIFMFHYRYAAHLFVAFLLACWLARLLETPGAPRVRRAASVRESLLTVVLVAQLVAGTLCYALDWQLPFSGSQRAAQEIRRSGLAGLPLVGAGDFVVSPLAALLQRDIFYPERGEYGSFVIWDERRNPEISFSEIVDAVDRQLTETGGELLLILHFQPATPSEGKMVNAMLREDILAELVASAERSVVVDEHYWVYRVRRWPPAAAVHTGTGSDLTLIGVPVVLHPKQTGTSPTPRKPA